MSQSGDKDLQQRMERVEALLGEVERFSDPRAQEVARAVVQALLDLHGAGLATMLELTAQRGEAGQELLGDFARDELVANLLLLHGLHPEGVEARIRTALERLRPFLRSHKAEVELLAVSDSSVRLRLQRSGEGCSSSGTTLKTALEDAIAAAAPDVGAVEIDEIVLATSIEGRLALPLVR